MVKHIFGTEMELYGALIGRFELVELLSNRFCSIRKILHHMRSAIEFSETDLLKEIETLQGIGHSTNAIIESGQEMRMSVSKSIAEAALKKGRAAKARKEFI